MSRFLTILAGVGFAAIVTLWTCMIVSVCDAQDPIVVEGRKHDKNKHVAPAPPIEPTPAPKPVRPHIEPVPDEHFIDVVDGKHPKPDKHKVIVPDPKPAPTPHVEPVKPVVKFIWIVRGMLVGLVVAGIVVASLVHGRRL